MSHKNHNSNIIYTKTKYIHKSNHQSKNRPQACTFIKKETLAQVFSCELCEISKNTHQQIQLHCIKYIRPLGLSVESFLGFNTSILLAPLGPKRVSNICWHMLNRSQYFFDPEIVQDLSKNLPQISLGPFLNTLSHMNFAIHNCGREPLKHLRCLSSTNFTRPILE